MSPPCLRTETAVAGPRSPHAQATTPSRRPDRRSAASPCGRTDHRRRCAVASGRGRAVASLRPRAAACLSGCASARPCDCAAARTRTCAPTRLRHRAAAQVCEDASAQRSTCAVAHLCGAGCRWGWSW
jgi:hypothetical protein